MPLEARSPPPEPNRTRASQRQNAHHENKPDFPGRFGRQAGVNLGALTLKRYPEARQDSFGGHRGRWLSNHGSSSTLWKSSIARSTPEKVRRVLLIPTTLAPAARAAWHPDSESSKTTQFSGETLNSFATRR
jgi:hypothetical protein